MHISTGRGVDNGVGVLPAKMVKIVMTIGSQHFAGMSKFHRCAVGWH